MIVCLGKDRHVTPVLHDLHWLPIKLSVHFKVLLYTYKGLNGRQCVLVVPKIRTKGYGGRKFSHAAATLWNDLHSIDLKRVETVSAFKSGLKTYFFKLYFYKK